MIRIERYDFTENGNSADDILSDVEDLNIKQRLALHEAIKQIKINIESETVTKHMEWFDTAIFPVLKEYAELTCSILDIERDKKEIIQATLRNSNGLDFAENSRCLYMAIIMAVQIFVDVEQGDPVLILTYDCRKFIN